MPVFNLFMKITKSKKYIILMYYGIFLGIFLLISNITPNSEDTLFQEVPLPIGIVYQEDTPLTQGIEKFLSRRHRTQSLPDEKEALQNALYTADIAYIIRIPKGFTQDFLDGKDTALETITSPADYASGYLADAQLDDFLGNVRLYLSGGLSLTEALDKAASLDDISVSITYPENQKITASEEMPTSYYYFRYFAYVALSVILSCICPILIVFYQPDVYRRCICSSTRLKTYHVQLTLGTLLFSLAVLVSLDLIGILSNHDTINTAQFGYLILNTSAFILVSTSLAYLCGMIAKKQAVVSGLSNVIGLSFCFLGGIFVSLDMIHPKVLLFSRLLPTYWYTVVNQTIFESTAPNAQQVTLIFQGLGIQLAFTLAVCSVALLVSRRRQQYINL